MVQLRFPHSHAMRRAFRADPDSPQRQRRRFTRIKKRSRARADEVGETDVITPPAKAGGFLRSHPPQQRLLGLRMTLPIGSEHRLL